MKIAFLLVVFLGLVLADVRDPNGKKHNQKQHKQGIKAILKHMYKETFKKKINTIKLRKESKLKFFKLAYTRENILELLAMQSDADLLNITQQLVVSRATTALSTEVLMEMINTTVTSMKKLLENAPTDIKDLSTSFLGQIKQFSNTSSEQIQDTLEKGERKSAKVVKKKLLKTIHKLSGAIKRRIFESYSVSEKEVMDLAHTGGVSILEAADRETSQFQNFTAYDKKLQRYVKFATRKIYDLAKNISDQYTELALGSLKGLKQLVNDTEKTVKEFAHREIRFAQDLAKNKAASGNMSDNTGRNLTGSDDPNKNGFAKIVGSITANLNTALDDASKSIELITARSPNNYLCLSL